MRELIAFLKSININTLYAVSIHKQYGIDSIEILTKDPYRLMDDIKGIVFEDGIRK